MHHEMAISSARRVLSETLGKYQERDLNLAYYSMDRTEKSNFLLRASFDLDRVREQNIPGIVRALREAYQRRVSPEVTGKLLQGMDVSYWRLETFVDRLMPEDDDYETIPSPADFASHLYGPQKKLMAAGRTTEGAVTSWTPVNPEE